MNTEIIQDETGAISTARTALWVVLAVTLLLVVLDASPLDWEVPSAAYSLLGGTILALAGWAAGPRIMQHISPHLTGLPKVLADAKLPNIRKDDER